ncbi:MAG: type II secretion system protein [Patescibacteria group bacterium]|jgi:prepilin-type N-terminal cleavage/methylation domain-containing protein|nr:type II secretion system protein [Patescibacteria group bacterium]
MKYLKNNKGFTLIELLVYMLIFSSLVFMSSDFVINGFRATTFGIEQEEATKNAKKTVDSMVLEIREARSSSRGDYLLDDVSSQSLSFYSDIDSDSNIEKVRYFIDGDILKKGTIEPLGSPLEYLSINEVIEIVAENINNQVLDVFTYFDTDQNQIINPGGDRDRIRLIKVSLLVNVTPEIMPADYIIDMDIHIRNLKDNL